MMRLICATMKQVPNMRDRDSRVEIESKIESALHELVSRDSYLLEMGLGERCIAHRFAFHLAQVFPEWDVDCEYNRNGHRFKELPLSDECRELLRKSDRVVPDIVVHKRGEDGPNLLAIELKIEGRPGEDCDLSKLRGYMSVIGYSFGFYVCFRNGNVAEHIVKKIIFPEKPSN